MDLGNFPTTDSNSQYVSPKSGIPKERIVNFEKIEIARYADHYFARIV